MRPTTVRVASLFLIFTLNIQSLAYGQNLPGGVPEVDTPAYEAACNQWRRKAQQMERQLMQEACDMQGSMQGATAFRTSAGATNGGGLTSAQTDRALSHLRDLEQMLDLDRRLLQGLEELRMAEGNSAPSSFIQGVVRYGILTVGSVATVLSKSSTHFNTFGWALTFLYGSLFMGWFAPWVMERILSTPRRYGEATSDDLFDSRASLESLMNNCYFAELHRLGVISEFGTWEQNMERLRGLVRTRLAATQGVAAAEQAVIQAGSNSVSGHVTEARRRLADAWRRFWEGWRRGGARVRVDAQGQNPDCSRLRVEAHEPARNPGADHGADHGEEIPAGGEGEREHQEGRRRGMGSGLVPVLVSGLLVSRQNDAAVCVGPSQALPRVQPLSPEALASWVHPQPSAPVCQPHQIDAFAETLVATSRYQSDQAARRRHAQLGEPTAGTTLGTLAAVTLPITALALAQTGEPGVAALMNLLRYLATSVETLGAAEVGQGALAAATAGALLHSSVAQAQPRLQAGSTDAPSSAQRIPIPVVFANGSGAPNTSTPTTCQAGAALLQAALSRALAREQDPRQALCDAPARAPAPQDPDVPASFTPAVLQGR